jgi:hypothetical protein
MADCREYIEKLAVLFRCVSNAVGRNHWKSERGCKTQQRLIAALFVALLVALEFEIETAVTVDCCEPFYEFVCLVMPAVR